MPPTEPTTPVRVPKAVASYAPTTQDPDLRSQINTVLLRDGHVNKYTLPLPSLLHSPIYSLLSLEPLIYANIKLTQCPLQNPRKPSPHTQLLSYKLADPHTKPRPDPPTRGGHHLVSCADEPSTGGYQER